jgi:Uma2 family endonuclease
MNMQIQAQETSVFEYQTIDEHSDLRHEYAAGEIYAMTGGSRRHGILTGNLHWHAKKSAAGYCNIFLPIVKLLIPSRGRYYYPDVMGCCDPGDDNDRYVTEPCFIAEVLSPSTARFDRREKWEAYQTLHTLDEYVLISQDRMQVTVFRRMNAQWPSQILREPDDVLELTCISLRLSLRDLYDGVRLPSPQVRDDIKVPEYVTAA